MFGRKAPHLINVKIQPKGVIFFFFDDNNSDVEQLTELQLDVVKQAKSNHEDKQKLNYDPQSNNEGLPDTN